MTRFAGLALSQKDLATFASKVCDQSRLLNIFILGNLDADISYKNLNTFNFNKVFIFKITDACQGIVNVAYSNFRTATGVVANENGIREIAERQKLEIFAS